MERGLKDPSYYTAHIKCQNCNTQSIHCGMYENAVWHWNNHIGNGKRISIENE